MESWVGCGMLQLPLMYISFWGASPIVMGQFELEVLRSETA